MIDFSKIKKLTIDGIDLKSMAINGIQVWKSGPKNWVKFSTESDGVTIYNGGLGYKDGYRIRSGGAEATLGSGTVTGFIPFKKGDILRIYPAFFGANNVNAINFADATHANLGQVVGNGTVYGICTSEPTSFRPTKEGSVTVLHLTTDKAADVAYIRITNQIGTYDSIPPVVESGADMIVTINEEIE